MNFLMGGAKGGLTGGFGIGGMIRDVLSKINNPIMNSFNLPNISPMTSVQPRPEDFVEVFPDLQERPTIETYPDMQEPPMPEIYPDMQKVHTPEVFPDMQEPSEPETLPSGDDVMREAGIDIRPFHTMYIGASPEEQGAFDPLFDKGKTRKEISDKMANILPKEQWNETIPFSGGGKLKDILAHSELYNKYPELADMPVEMVLGSGTSPFVKSNLGSYDNGKINLSGDLYPYPDEIRNTLLHEIQHAIQGKEGWASGGSPTNTKPEMVEDDINALFDAANMRAYMEQNGVNVGQAKEWYRSNFGREPHKFAGQFARTETSDSISNLINEQKQRLSEAKDPYGHYLRLAGEIEARDTASRKNMNMEQRLSTSPYAGQGIPLKDVITRNFSNKSMSINQPQPQGEGIWKEPYNMTLEEFKNPQLPKANEGEVILYHRLRYPTDLDSVLKEGLKLSKKTKGGEGGSGNMWFSIEPSGYSKEGTIIGIKVPKSEVDLQHYGQGQAVMFRDIKPSEIVYVDKKGYSEVSTGRRLSEERSSDYAEEYYKAYSKLSQPQGEGKYEFISDSMRHDYINAPAKKITTDDLSPAESSLLNQDNDYVYVKETPNYKVLTEKWTAGSRQGLREKYGKSDNQTVIDKLTPRFKEIARQNNLELISHEIKSGNSVVVFKKLSQPQGEGVQSLIDRYNDGDNQIATVEDVVDGVEEIISEKFKNAEDTDADYKLQKAIGKFRKEQEYDRKLKGRGDIDTARDKIMAAIEKYSKLSKPKGEGKVITQVDKMREGLKNKVLTIKPKTEGALKVSDSANGLLLEALKQLPGLSKAQANIYAGIIAEYEKHSQVEASDMAEAIGYTHDIGWINETNLNELFDYTHKTKPIWDRIKELKFDKIIDKKFERSLDHVKSLIADIPKDAKELLLMYISSNNEIIVEGKNNNRKITQDGLDKIEKILEDYHSKNNTGDDLNQKMVQALQIAQTTELADEEVAPDKSLAEKGFKLVGEHKTNVPVSIVSQFMRKGDKQVITPDGFISNGKWAVKKGILPKVEQKFTEPQKIDMPISKILDIKGTGKGWGKLKEWGTLEGNKDVFLLDKSNTVYAIDKRYYDYLVKNIKDVSFEGIVFNRPVKIYSGDKMVGVVAGKTSEYARRIEAYLKQPTQPTLPTTGEKKGISDFGEKIGGARKDTAERGYTKTPKTKTESEGPAWKQKYIVAEKVDGSGWTIILKDQPKYIRSERGQVFSTKEEAEKAIPLYAVAQSHRVYQGKDGKGWGIYKKVSDKKLFKVVNQTFASREEAMKYMTLHAEEILNLKTNFGEEILPSPVIAKRTGVERRKGDVTPQMIMDTFAPRGIEFGNWNNQQERQELLNHAYDSLLDLADVLQLAPKELMFNGQLGLGFGARGKGLSGAKAHYEPDYGVINLTKVRGAGSLAHEWFHALDNYLARLDGKAGSERIKNSRGDLVFPIKTTDRAMLSYGASYSSKLDQRLLESYKTLIDTMFRKAEQYIEDTERADKFLSTARNELKKKLDGIRTNLEKDLSKEYTWRKNSKGLNPASVEQLSEFDKLSNILVEGGDLETKFKYDEVNKLSSRLKSMLSGKQSNPTLDSISTILKDVRNRNGFNSEGTGTLDDLRHYMTLYKQRLDMFKNAKDKVTLTKTVPTDFAIEARKMDQARTGDYWSNPNEMAARAFAAYIEDKIAEGGGQSDFLVYHAHGGILVPMIDGFVARPYPEGKERELINNAFDLFIDKIKNISDLKAKPRPGQAGYVDIIGLLNIGSWDKIRQAVEDDWIKVRRLIERTGTVVTEQNNPYEAEIRYWGRLGTRMEESNKVITDIDNDIVKTAKRLNISDKVLSKEIDKYLVSRHAPERNAQHGNSAAGMTDAEALQNLIDIDSKPYVAEVKRIAQTISDLNSKTLDVLLESGVLSQEMYNNLRKLYPNHIPLNRVLSEDDDIVEVLTRRGFNVKGTGLKRAKGSELEIADILTNVTANYKAALARAEKNIVDNYTLKFARENEYFDGLMEEIKPAAIGKTFDGQIILQEIKDPSVLSLRENGKQIYLKINDVQLAMALRGVNRARVDGLIRGVQRFTRIYSSLMTRFNPEFTIPNKVRDLQEVAVYLAAKDEIGFKGAAKTLIGDPQSLKDITDYFRGVDTPGTRLYKQMKLDGGTTGGMGLSTREQLVIDIDKIRQLNRSAPRKALQQILGSIDAWNTIFEDSTRLSVYRQALKQGVSRERAAVLAKEASINFNKMGAGSPIINALYMFSNASIQGTYKMFRAMKNPKVFTAVLTLMAGAVALVNQYNDNKDKDWRKKVSKWDRLNGLNIVISTNKGIKYVTIPISWGLKPIKVFFDTISDLSSGYEKDMKEAVSKLFASAIEAYNPIGGVDLISAITPTVLDLPVDLARNIKWTGGKIRPDWNSSAPESIQYFDSLRKTLAGKIAIEATRELGEHGFEISPANIVYAYEQYIGGAGRFIDKFLNTVSGFTQGKVKTKNIPFVSRFYRDIPEDEIREYGGAEYSNLRKILQQQDKDNFYANQEAEQIWDGMKTIPVEDRKKHYKQLLETHPAMAEKVKQVAIEDQNKLTYTDRLIKKLGVVNGQRSKYLWNKIEAFPTFNQRVTYYKNMQNKGVITEEVARQIKIRAKLKK